MKQQDEELLLKDLCARLPYGVKGVVTYDISNTIFTVEGFDDNVLHLSYAEECYVKDFKPYLRPISSMTEEEVAEFESITDEFLEHGTSEEIWNTVIDWLNAHHFDHRHLIEKGLALEAPKGMYDIKS